MISDDESILLALQRATHATFEALASELGDLTLPASELNVLANLADTGRRSVSALAAEVGSRATTMTSTLDRLERRGFLQRRPHPDDRRSSVAELTTTGRRAARRVRIAMGAVEDDALAELSPAERDTLRRALDALAAVPT